MAGERISCLMVTRPCAERFELFQRSVACFRAQTYPDRELVVVLDDEPAEWVERFTAHLADVPGGAVVVPTPGGLPLGALRNRSIEAASGTVLCQWDDDDLSHPQRLAAQLAALQGGRALGVALEEVLHLFAPSRRLYWETYRYTPLRCFPGSLLFRRGVAARYPAEGPNCRKGEDVVFLTALRGEGEVVRLAGSPHLYVYVYHGGNTHEDTHHQGLAASLGLSRGLLLRRRAALEELAGLDLGAQALDVMGSNGPAFQIPGSALTRPGHAEVREAV